MGKQIDQLSVKILPWTGLLLLFAVLKGSLVDGVLPTSVEEPSGSLPPLWIFTADTGLLDQWVPF
jgi:hypothetical protein